MKLAFSEAAHDHGRYIYPYAVWAFPEPGESPADLFAAGFLPSSRHLDRFYLCRHLRVRLPAFQLSSENRRILRKCPDISAEIIPRASFDDSPARRTSWLQYARVRFGESVMTEERLDGLMTSAVVSHVLRFFRPDTGKDAGAVLMYLEPPRMAYYYYAFYDLELFPQNLGIHMMTQAARHFSEAGFEFLYLGTCYSDRALYKTQFQGIQFFNGVGWSENLDELKFLLRRGADGQKRPHALEDPEYLAYFTNRSLQEHVRQSHFQTPTPAPAPAPAPRHP